MATRTRWTAPARVVVVTEGDVSEADVRAELVAFADATWPLAERELESGTIRVYISRDDAAGLVQLDLGLERG